MFYTYVLKSSKDSRLYVGCTNNLRKRMEEHIAGNVESTKYRLPIKLVYYEACSNKVNAYKREQYFKTGYGRRFLMNRI
jgi:putative endonuclease